MSVLERAHIVLLPTDGSLKLVLVDPSPCCRMLMFITYPAWWSAADICPFLLSWSEDGVPPFVEVARRENVLADFLPEAGTDTSATVDVFTNIDVQTLQPDAPFVPQPGALVLTRPPRDDAPEVAHAQEVVNSHANAFEHGDQYPQWPDGRDHTLLLGVMFEQVLVKLEGNPREVELAAAYDVTLGDAVWFYPAESFENLAFRGTPVQHLAAVRRLSVHGSAVRGTGVFIDPIQET